MIKRNIIITALLFISIGLTAQTEYMKHIQVEKNIEKVNDQVILNFDIILDNLNMHTEHMMVLTPVIASPDSTMTRELAPIVINGRNKQKSLNRTMALNNKPAFNPEPYTILRRHNNTSQNVVYRVSTPYEGWMANGSLILHEEITGCAFCEVTTEEKIWKPIFKDPYIPVYSVAFITPEVEPIKERSEELELYLNFKVGRWEILPTFQNNATELEKFASSFRKVRDNKDLSINELKITGYASPEGSFESNMKLSERRAKSLANYLSEQHVFDKKILNLDWKGEDWDGLVKALEASFLPDKERVLDIIRNYSLEQGREQKIMALNGGETYKVMLRDLYPPLRRNSCVIKFTVAAFDVDKAREIIKTDPKLLSLQEMYLVANSYEKGSPENIEVFNTALEFFPNSIDAVNNAAAAAIENGKFDDAYRLLQSPSAERAEIWNNLGIIFANNRQFDEAREMFTRASEQGSEEAGRNIIELDKLLEDLSVFDPYK